jgi:hypothetical protein
MQNTAKQNTSHPSFTNSISSLQQFISDTIPLSNERSLKLVFFDTMPDSFPPHGINTEVFSNSGNTTLQNSLIFTFAPQARQKSKYSSHFRGMGVGLSFSHKGIETIINLTSKKYSRCLEKYLQPDDRFITCIFGEPEQIKAFNWSGYHFNADRSSDMEFVFIRTGIPGKKAGRS